MRVSHLFPIREFIMDGPNQQGHQKSSLVVFLFIIGSLMTVWSRPKPCKPTNEKVSYGTFSLVSESTNWYWLGGPGISSLVAI